MKLSKLILFLAIFFSVVFVVIFVISSTEKDLNYKEGVNKAQVERHKSLVEQIRAAQLKQLPSNKKIFDKLPKKDFLQFYPIKYDYKVLAKVTRIKGFQFEFLQATDGSSIKYIKYAKLNFKLNGKNLELTLLQNSEDNSDFFLPFMDKTNGNSTYGSGRYINLIYKGEQEIDLDFNLAYNPYCAYNNNFICPIPPLYNSLDAAIEAGEKSPKK